MNSHTPASVATLEEMPQPDTAAAVDFLRQFRPEGPWVLTAIQPDGNGIATATFRPETEKELLAWLEKYNGIRNLYFSVNRCLTDLTKKASKKDIKTVDWLHVDIDPRPRDDIEAEQARIIGLLTDKLPKGVPAPTCIIFSGGGYQGFWRLKTPIEIGGNLAKAEEAALYNKQLEELLGGDNCHNVDRIMRLPGTINIPDAGKIKKGRKRALAKLISFNEKLVYPLTDFVQAVSVRMPGIGTIERKATVEISGDIEYFGDVHRLDKWKVPDRTKVIIVRGHHPDETKPQGKDTSASGWLWDVSCNLARCGVPDDVFYSVLTNPNFGISASVVKNGGDRYVRRQIQRAKEQVQADKDEFEVGENGVPRKNLHNIRVALRKMGVRLSHDQFADELLVEGLSGFGPALQDEGVTRLWLSIDEHFQFRPAKDFFWTVVGDAARLHGFHPVREYLDGLNWDGEPRLDTWLIEYGGAEDTPYVRAVGALVLIAAVRRIRQPGCKFDEMLVLRSPQGTQKSSALLALAPTPEWFSDDLPLNADTKVIIERLHGRWIVEAAELKGMRKGEVEHLKAFLSRQIDCARMAYARIPKKVPRQCIFIGTTNSEHFLRDPTGDRRYWPVTVTGFDVEAIKRDRDQLWAEAAHREATGASIRLDPKLWPAATEAQLAHRLDDTYLEHLDAVLGDLEGKLSTRDAWKIMSVPPGQRTQFHNERLGEAMRELGWERKKLRFDGSSPEWGYVRGSGRVAEKKTVHKRIIVSHDERGEASAEYKYLAAPF